MDPNEALARIRAIVVRIESGEVYPPDDERAEAEELAELISGLDGWITNGGFLPAAWRRDG